MTEQIAKVKIDVPWGWELPALNSEQAAWLDEWFSRRALSAATSAPRRCSTGCTFRNQCPLEALQAPMPTGCPCPIERTQLRGWASEMKTALELDDEDRWSHMLVEYFALWNLLIQRALTDPEAEKILVRSYKGVDREGSAIYEKVINPILVFVRDAQRILREIGRDLVATRESKAKLRQGHQSVGPETILRQIEARIAEVDVQVSGQRSLISGGPEGAAVPVLSPILPDAPTLDT